MTWNRSSTLTPHPPHRPAAVSRLAPIFALCAILFTLEKPAFSQRPRLTLVGFSGGGIAGDPGRGGPPSPPSQGFLGIGFRDISEDRVALLKLKETRGAEVVQVDHDGPAGIAGLTEHDVILQVNGQAIEGEEQLRRILRETPVGRSVTIVFSRSGQQQTITTQMADRAQLERQSWEQHQSVPDPSRSSSFRGGNGFLSASGMRRPAAGESITAPPDSHGHSLLPSMLLNSSYTGVVLEMIGPQLAQYFGSPGGNGLLVRSVDPDSPAATAGLRAGDVVVRANAVIVTGTNEWYKLVRENKGKQISVVIMRDREEETLILVPDSKKRSSMERLGPWQSDPAAEHQFAAKVGGGPELN